MSAESVGRRETEFGIRTTLVEKLIIGVAVIGTVSLFAISGYDVANSMLNAVLIVFGWVYVLRIITGWCEGVLA